MVLTALRGALAFLTRLPVPADDEAWDAFRSTPVAFPLAGYLIGFVVALPLVVPLPVPTLAVGFLLTLYLVTGVTHVDGLADLGDAAAAHGADPTAAMRDERVGAGGVLVVALTLLALAFGVLGLAGAGPVAAVFVVVAAEVGAKAGLAVLVARSPAAHEGLGSAFVDDAGGRSLWPVALALVPLLALALVPAGSPALAVALRSGGVAVVAALVSALVVCRLVGRWATARFGGVSGDVLGAANELARAVAVHAGVVAWTLS